MFHFSKSVYVLGCVSESPGQLYFRFFCPTFGDDDLLILMWYRDMYTFKGAPNDCDRHLLLEITVLGTIHKTYLKYLFRIQIWGPYSRARESEYLRVGSKNLHFHKRLI